MTTSKRKNVPSPNEGKGSVYSRFIPREEVSSFSAWTPGQFDGRPDPTASLREPPPEPPPPPAGPTEQQVAAALHSARQTGYQDGYRDGLAALEAFKQSYAGAVSAQLGLLVESHDRQLTALQHDMAQALAACALSLARQMVRNELLQRPEQVAVVARGAVEALLLSARHVTVRVHPDDLPLVAQGAGEALAARGARLVDDASLTRGGCRVDSDIGGVDATIEARWQQTAAAIGHASDWTAGGEAAE